MHMSHALNGNSAIWCFDCGNAIEIYNRIIFCFSPGLPQVSLSLFERHVLRGMFVFCPVKVVTVYEMR